jgi:methylated-DNA-[protein]-cysteine S-methyltransferase
MNECAFTIFETAIGRCALLWRGGLIVGAALPDADEERFRASIQRRFPGAQESSPPRVVERAIGAVIRLLEGKSEDLTELELDLGALGEFEQRVLAITRGIPFGETRTYGEIASELGSPGAARAVGRALGVNPIPIVIPCHRVVAAAGRSGGFSAPGGAATKLKMLEIENASRGSDPQLFDRLPWAMRPAG